MELFNTNQYPIHDLANMSSELETQKKRYETDGVMVLDHFLKRECMEALLDECQSIKNQAYFNTVSGNPYLCEADPTLPDDHALNSKESTTLGVIAGDQLPPNSISQQIYLSLIHI